MQQYSGYVDQPGLQQAFATAGIACWWEAGAFYVSNLSTAQSIVSSYNPLPAIQQAALETVAATLAARIAAGFTYNTVLIACDDVTQGKISRVAQMAADIISGQITKSWTTRNWPSMTPGAAGLSLSTPQEMIAFGAAVGSYVADNEFYAANLASQILSSTATASSIASLDLTNSQGTWPNS